MGKQTNKKYMHTGCGILINENAANIFLLLTSNNSLYISINGKLSNRLYYSKYEYIRVYKSGYI